MLPAARTQARESFIKNRKLESGSNEATQAIQHAQGVAQILRENVVQGENRGGEHYKLRITEHTQRLEAINCLSNSTLFITKSWSWPWMQPLRGHARTFCGAGG